ncbi:MAG: TonB-dependent receptor [Gammaproteobacteria bacterium]|nr:TonB-dependent receptor [Gammaproteobacteria bacterium]
MKHLPLARLPGALLLGLLTFPALAQEPTTEQAIDEITVTADFRGRALSELPSSVSVIDASVIEEAAVQHFEELVNIVPNLSWSGDGHRARYFQIRGVGELEQYQGAPNPSVGFLIDDIDFSGIGTIATLFDIESIEVLRGSQGSRYGANALGGLIYMRSTAPSAERDGRVQLTVGDDDALTVGAAFGGAINDEETVLFRLSAQKHESNGFRDNPWLGREDTNGRNETGVRFGLAFEPSDAIDGRLSLVYGKIDNGYDAFSLDNSYTMLSDKPGKDAQESVAGSLRFDWDGVGRGALTSITTFASSDIDFSFDADWGNDESWAPVLYDYISISDRQRDTISQEFRYTMDRWLFGLYVLNLSEDLATLNQGEYYDPGYDWADSLDYPFDSEYESTSMAAFAQYDRDFGDATRVSAGLRVERRTADYADSDGFLASPADTFWGGDLSVSHDFSADVTGFAALSRGYKAGGFNLGLVPDNWRFFEAEAMWTLESGIKSSLLGDTLRLNASVFHSWREDQQVRASFQLVPNDPASFGFATINIDGGRTYGAEVDLRWYPASDLEVYASAGLLRGGFPDSVEEFPWLGGRDQAHAPRYTLAAGVVYRNTNGFFARLDATARDEFYFDVSHDQASQAYELLHARVGFEGENWIIQVWGRNLTDEEYAVRGFFFGNEPPDFPATLYTRLGDPRQVGVTIERRFH